MSFPFLALGDSYTIGEGVHLSESFPYQTVRLLRAAGLETGAAEIVAKTGWTTDELAAGIAAQRLLAVYDLVSLLIGVNNQYRGRSLQEYETGFESLLLQSIGFAGGRAARVFALSIPDWGITSFAGLHLPDAGGRDQPVIAREIDAFNAAAAAITSRHGVRFVDITGHSRTCEAMPGAFAEDGLHPSGMQYRYWAQQLAAAILEELGQRPGSEDLSG